MHPKSSSTSISIELSRFIRPNCNQKSFIIVIIVVICIQRKKRGLQEPVPKPVQRSSVRTVVSIVAFVASVAFVAFVVVRVLITPAPPQNLIHSFKGYHPFDRYRYRVSVSKKKKKKKKKKNKESGKSKRRSFDRIRKPAIAISISNHPTVDVKEACVWFGHKRKKSKS